MYLAQLQAVIVWKEVNAIDLWLIRQINQQWSNEWLDWLCLHARETMFWFPLYLFLFIFIMMNFGTKGIWWVAGVLLTAALSDLVSSSVVKELIFRTRPCQDPEVGSSLRFFINYCPQSSSFTSSHATSHFAQAVFFYITLRHTGRFWWLAFLWAGLIAYSQVYVGVHYPSDVIAGALLGAGIGFFASWIFRKQAGRLPN